MLSSLTINRIYQKTFQVKYNNLIFFPPSLFSCTIFSRNKTKQALKRILSWKPVKNGMTPKHLLIKRDLLTKKLYEHLACTGWKYPTFRICKPLCKSFLKSLVYLYPSVSCKPRQSVNCYKVKGSTQLQHWALAEGDQVYIKAFEDFSGIFLSNIL